MNLNKPNYFVVKNAKRKIISVLPDYSTDIIVRSYRNGELGLFHPDVLRYCENPVRPKGVSIPLGKKTIWGPAEFYRYAEGDIPLVKWKEGSKFFLTFFREEELLEVRGNLESILRGSLKYTYPETGFPITSEGTRNYRFKMKIKEELINLQKFETLMIDNLYLVTPELSRIEITDEDLKREVNRYVNNKLFIEARLRGEIPDVIFKTNQEPPLSF
ncbi:hypothetical protein J4446_02740 [Candidatus Woesearchaeota archaeon]|nr:hypothetical protein [Candidatus Woesearchaeota archaeon]